MERDVQDVPHTPGLYFERHVEATLYSSEWKVKTDVDLQQAGDNLDMTDRYNELTMGLLQET
jgi:hypothetical protein